MAESQGFSEPVDLAEIGIRSIHGVPGDYNLEALDYVEPAGLLWVGNCNELNAGYAADGYARIKGISAVVTKSGVGELSALNAVAGAYSEYIPMIHIVGTPPTVAQANNMHLEHTLSNGDQKVFETIARQVTCAVAVLDGSRDAAASVDEVIAHCLIQSRPVYIALPVDMVERKVEGRRLKTQIDIPVPATDQEMEEHAVGLILGLLQMAKAPAVLVDAGAFRRKSLEEVHAFLQKFPLPAFVSPMGKGAVDESLSNFKGVYAGRSSDPSIQEYFKSVDLLLHIGSIKSDSTTAWFDPKPAPHAATVKIPVNDEAIQINQSNFPGVQLVGLLRKLIDRGDMPIRNIQSQPAINGKSTDAGRETLDSVIEHRWLWPRLSKWLQEGDVVITETGTANYGIRETTFPSKIRAICQPLWSSIGYATAACQGVALAARELGIERTILLTGEGSFQVSGQELRFIHGMDAHYNDVQPWKYADLCHVYGGERITMAYKIETKAQMERLLSDPEFATGRQLRFVEVYMRQDDAPVALINAVKAM
ncbi:MAG: Pyruvate decarboxylase 1 [Peltula sp. TS41687]|nr:MAG: Pyruvate decarboxylase 1 [Peltula sp. TS41687]